MATRTFERDRRTASSNGRPPEKPTRLRTRSWFGVLRRTIREFKEDNVTNWAAALTYYGVLAIFPAIIALVSVLGLIGPSATQPLITNLGKLAPRLGPPDSHQRDRGSPAQPRRGRDPLHRGHRRRDLVGVRLHRGVHACLERDL